MSTLTELGCVKFNVKNEFSLQLTIVSDDFSIPWNLINIKFLVKDSFHPSKIKIYLFLLSSI